MSRKNRRKNGEPPALKVPPAEQLLIDELPAIAEMRILCTSLGRGQFAAAALRQRPDAQIVLHELDLYLADQARRFLAEQSVGGAGEAESGGETSATGEPATEAIPARAGGVEVVCSADFPEGDFELAALPIDQRGEAELTREFLQTAHDRIRVGGRLIAAIANSEDQWLHDELRKLFPKVTRRPFKRGVLYLATKTGPIRKRKYFESEFMFRDGERLFRAVSRPGVFNHRSLDGGARALMNTMQIAEGARVVDLGCGSGVVALAAACRAPGVAVTAIDSSARAIECTARGAAMNDLTNVTTVLNAEGETGAPATFDLVLGNPPYYSDYRIAEIFLQGARRALKPGGKVLIVTKALAWYEERMPELFDNVRRNPHKLYTVLEGTRPATD